MSITAIRGTTDKPASSTGLVHLLCEADGLNGKLFVGFPMIKTGQGPRTIDALLISPDHGLVIFDLIEGQCVDGFPQRQDDAANALDSRLRVHPGLLFRRNLKIPIHPISFAPALFQDVSSDDDGYIVKTRKSLVSALDSLRWTDFSEDIYDLTLSVLENVSTIRTRRTPRNTTQPSSRGNKLKMLEDSVATLDPDQSAAVIQTVDGIQRIRGLAGSGKTIILALKAAYLHAQHPDWMIGVTFGTQSLKRLFTTLIRRFSLDQTGEEPDWNNLRILNAWGSEAPIRSDRTGIYAQYCLLSDSEYLGYHEARQMFRTGDVFEHVCRDVLLKTQNRSIQSLYNALLVDDSQDFSADFLRICYRLLDPMKRLTYSYDELQSLTSQTLPSPEAIFQRKQPSALAVAAQMVPDNILKSDIVLPRCYRNSRPILVTAHSIGFGIYRQANDDANTNLVQMFDRPKLWENIGYETKAGVLSEGESVTLFRPPKSSPEFLENHSSTDDIIRFIAFKSQEEQSDWLVNAIATNLGTDELRANDIVVINPNPFTTREEVGPIRSRLFDMGINSRLAGIDTHPDVLFKEDESSVIFAGIYRAKGNESGMVYIINAHDGISNEYGQSYVRNRLFTAITRSKAWVRVLGVGQGMQQLVREFTELQRANFELRFRYPSVTERNRLRIVHKDLSRAEEDELTRSRVKVDEVVRRYREGKLDEESMEKLERLGGGVE